MAKVIMIQGTMSSVGKSLMTAGLCRVLAEDGYRVAPFKSQNMSRNVYVTEDGLHMSSAQVIQAEAAGIEPSAEMNPIFLKPVSDMGSEVYVAGRSQGLMRAKAYYAFKRSLIPLVLASYEKLAADYDIVVVEGAGSPAEINLKDGDLVNMGLAKMLDAPVLLVGDIDCGGVFAQIVGTLTLLEDDERARVKGVIINKFRGDIDILKPGLLSLESISQKRVVGVLPYLDVDIEEEDSLIRTKKVKAISDKRRSHAYRERQYDILAEAIRQHLDLSFIYETLGIRKDTPYA